MDLHPTFLQRPFLLLCQSLCHRLTQVAIDSCYYKLGFTPFYSKLTQEQRSHCRFTNGTIYIRCLWAPGSKHQPIYIMAFRSHGMLPLGDWALPFTTRFTLRNPFSLPYSKLWSTPVGTAPCTYSVYKAAHSQYSVASASPSSFSPRQVSAYHRSCIMLLPAYSLPKASFCKDLLSMTLPTCIQQRMKFSGFACKSLNKLIHSLNGNYVCFETYTPKFRSVYWKNSFTLPNGMIVFDYSFSFMARTNFGSNILGEALPMRLKLIDLPLPDFTGSCYGRSPPEGAGREAAGPTSKLMEDHGSAVPARTFLKSKGKRHRFTIITAGSEPFGPMRLPRSTRSQGNIQMI